MPVPRPVTWATGAPVKQAATALEGVVLAMPISPVPKMTPSVAYSPAIPIPTSMHLTASSRVIAGPFLILPLPLTTFRFTRPSASAKSKSTPISTTTTSAPTCFAITFIPAPPFRKFKTICGVTSFGKAETPSSATPWSAAKTKMTRRSIRGVSSPVMATILLANSSSPPRLPFGFVSESSLSAALSINAVSTGDMDSIVSSSVFNTTDIRELLL